VEEDWPPPEARARAALWEAERHLLAGAYAAAGDSLGDAISFDSASSVAVARGLRQLAAAGYRHLEGDAVRAARLLEQARAELEPFLPVYEEVDLSTLLDVVSASLAS
jgi:hypothetical protein